MDFSTYQSATDETAIYPEAGTGSPAAINYSILGLIGEAGAIANKWKKFYRDGESLDELLPLMLAEAGDALYYLARFCVEAGQEFDLVAQGNLAKLQDRRERGVLQGYGSNR